MSLASARVRLGLTLVVIVSFAIVVAVCVSVLSIARGIDRTVSASGSPDIVVVYSAAADSEFGSTLSAEAIAIIQDHPSISRPAGRPLVSPSLVSSFGAHRKGTTLESNVVIRGITDAAFELNPNVKLIAGRSFQPGLAEAIVGARANLQFEGLSLGDRIRVGSVTATIVGIFESDVDLDQSEVWADVSLIQTAYGTGNVFSSARAKLTSPRMLEEFRAALASEARVNATVQTQRDYNARLGRWIIVLVSIIGSALAVLMGCAAILGATNVMDAAIAGRRRELATLRAIGFRRASVLFGVLVEGAVMGILGGVLGCAVAYLIFNGVQTSTISPAGFTQTAFTFAVTPDLIVISVACAAAMGILGALLPAISAAGTRVATVLSGEP